MNEDNDEDDDDDDDDDEDDDDDDDDDEDHIWPNCPLFLDGQLGPGAQIALNPQLWRRNAMILCHNAMMLPFYDDMMSTYYDYYYIGDVQTTGVGAAQHSNDDMMLWC